MDYSQPSKREVIEWSLVALLVITAIFVVSKVVVIL